MDGLHESTASWRNNDYSGKHRRACDLCTKYLYADHTIETVTTPATCTKPKTTVQKCTENCGYKLTTTEGAALGHDWSAWTDIGDATYHYKSCNRNCGVAQEKAYHEWDAGTVTTPPTESATGVMTYTCTGCGATKTESISACGHDWGKWEDTGVNATADVHVHSCRRDGCDAKEIGNHEWGSRFPRSR